MCMGAIIWANLDKVIYAGEAGDADDIGFRDDWIYQFIEEGCENDLVVPIEADKKGREEVLELYKEYSKGGEMY